MAFWLTADAYKQRLDACKSLQHTNTNVAAFTRTLNESQFAMRLRARNNQNNRPDKFILLQTDHMEKESGSMQLVKDGWFYFAPADDMKSDIVLEYQEFPSTALNEPYTFIGKLLCQYRPVIKFHPEKKKSLLILKLVKTTLNQSSWDNLTAFQQGNLQKALVHEIVLGNQSTFFPTRLSERVEQTKNQMGKNMYSTSQYQYIQNLLRRFYKEEEVTNDKIAKIIKQSLFMTNQKLWESQFAFDEIRPDRDSLYSIIELLDEKYFTLDVQEKNIWITYKHVDQLANFMMHDIARPMKDPLHHRRLLPMKNFFGTVGLKCQTCHTSHIFNHDEAYTKSFTDDDIAEMISSHTKQKGYFECCMCENQGR